jgi:hypothetical protein
VQRLMAGMGRGAAVDEKQWRAEIMQWVRVGAVPLPLHDNLQERFMLAQIKRSDVPSAQ